MKIYLIFLLIFIPIFNALFNGKVIKTELMTFNDMLFTKIFVGTPEEDFNLQLNLSSSIFWLINKDAKLTWKEPYDVHPPKKRYDQKNSSTSKILQESIKKEKINGISISDKIKIGDVPLIKVPFIAAKFGIPEFYRELDPISGSFGLSPKNNLHLNSILKNLDKQIITIKIKGGISGGGKIIPVGIGSLTFGGEDNDCNKYQYVPTGFDWSVGLQN
uniref:Peptidase A1 domain-containing protein n=1 Tax=Meloidogyne hapla TaxID=6305 RepID=A0A1I8B2S4_MELHA